MYTDRDYQIKHRFREEKLNEGQSLRTLFLSKQAGYDPTASIADPDLKRASIATLANCPPGLEMLNRVKKMYLHKRLDLVQLDTTGAYLGEILNEEGDRIFLIKTSTHYDSNEVIQYGKFKKRSIKGKFCYGFVNYVGAQVFQIYGDPERTIRIGPNSVVWGEIQVVPSPALEQIPLLCQCLCCYCCCCCCRHKNERDELNDTHDFRKATQRGETEIRVVVLKKDLGPKLRPGEHADPFFKHVYTIRGTVTQGCHHQTNNIFYKKSFNLRIYDKDVFNHDLDSEKPKDEKPSEKSKDEGTEGKPQESEGTEAKEKDAVNDGPIGYFSSNTHHEKLDCPLPTLELPQSMEVYDKITLMGCFFLFTLKI